MLTDCVSILLDNSLATFDPNESLNLIDSQKYLDVI